MEESAKERKKIESVRGRGERAEMEAERGRSQFARKSSRGRRSEIFARSQHKAQDPNWINNTMGWESQLGNPMRTLSQSWFLPRPTIRYCSL